VSVPAESAWVVLEAARLAVLHADFLVAVRPWPQVVAALLARQERRAEWLAHVLAISHLPRVETRVLTLFWLFADRWGRRRGAEVAVPIPLTHLNIVARLVGAQRPTVTTVLNKLWRETGDLAQERTGHWLLRTDPPSRAATPVQTPDAGARRPPMSATCPPPAGPKFRRAEPEQPGHRNLPLTLVRFTPRNCRPTVTRKERLLGVGRPEVHPGPDRWSTYAGPDPERQTRSKSGRAPMSTRARSRCSPC
jgi:hypothetical protein